MTRRQIIAEEWLIVDRNSGDELWSAVRKLPRGSGILLLALLDPKDCRRLRRLAQSRDLTIVVEAPRSAARVHNMRELTRARLRRTPMLLLSPVYPTSSHPQWQPLPRMRTATLARLANRRAVALGGMNRKRYAIVAPLGFIGWAGISAFRT
jgi:thiamine-phosphate pyrophosphorylase